jgi:hypothetical protein
MELEKVYLIQSITAAANNLRLNPQQIEVVGLLRETITKAEDVDSEFLKMKKSTELSKLAIRLSEIYSFLTQGKVDFIKISEQFKEHSRYLIRDLNQFLENVSPQIYKNAFNKINNVNSSTIDVELVDRSNLASTIMVDSKDNGKRETSHTEKSEFDQPIDFEKKILEPIKPMDELLNKMAAGNFDDLELKNFLDVFDENLSICNQKGLLVIAKMHLILISALKEILNDTLIINKSVIDSLRACLIVIVAVVKKKDIDINAYLNRAEEFGKKNLKNKIRV